MVPKEGQVARKDGRKEAPPGAFLSQGSAGLPALHSSQDLSRSPREVFKARHADCAEDPGPAALRRLTRPPPLCIRLPYLDESVAPLHLPNSSSAQLSLRLGHLPRASKSRWEVGAPHCQPGK